MSLDAYNRALFILNRSATTADSSNVTTSPVHPVDLELDSQLQTAAALGTLDSEMPENTMKAMVPKMVEFFDYCNKVYPLETHKYHLTSTKVYRFMWYVAFREKKPTGGRKRGTESNQQNRYFDLAAYNAIICDFRQPGSGESQLIWPRPRNPVSSSVFALYKAVFRNIHKVHVAQKLTSNTWEQIWTIHLDELHKIVKERQPEIRKESYQEKATEEFAPYTIVENYGNIEEELWQSSTIRNGHRTHVSGLRHRYLFLHLTSGILRAESLYKAELSDIIGIVPPCSHEDVHRMFIMVNQLPMGKTSQGRILYGRATRHRDVRLCCIGALAFYLQYRFYVTCEFRDFTVDDWLDNTKWFDIKLLTNVESCDHTSVMCNDSYKDKMKAVMSKLKLPMGKLLHLDRNVGPEILKFLQAESEDIQKMGNWNPSIHDSSYSTKLPMKAIRQLAGYPDGQSLYFNTRTALDPPEALLRATPMGQWVYEAHENVGRRCSESGSSKHQTAYQVLCFFVDLNRFFLQDAAAMICLYPERGRHKMYDEIPVFNHELWQPFVGEMKLKLETEECPFDAKLEAVLPSVHQWHQANQQAVAELVRETKLLREETKLFREETKKAIEAIQNDLRQSNMDFRRSIAMSSAALAKTLRAHAGSVVPEVAGLEELSTLMAASSPGTSPRFREDQQNNEHPPVDSRPFIMHPKHASIHNMYCEWHGISPFADPQGGVVGRNKAHGKKWRKEFNPNHYSRTSRIMKAVDRIISSDNLTWQNAVARLEPLYDRSGKSLSKMVDLLVDEGLLAKGKARGAKRKAKEAGIGVEKI
ncbi:centromere DNA-binding like protein [Nitzschia inconspicua]|uniref:Centromere DNA-binding like protein n=1 Tax=Nitzschia inconspicua TaxID=303405 RepID=A0A9K3Q5N9_9STRA|nr:centromere DNA-binding like protein [Nitzschia inconspicua]